MRSIFALGVALAISSSANASDLPPPLSLAHARAVVAATGVNVGKVFLDGAGNRYVIKRVKARSSRPGVFQVEVETAPLPRMER